MNITLSIDEQVAERARKAASAQGKSLNQAVRDYLEQLAGAQQLEAEMQTTPELMAGALDLHVLHGLSFCDAMIVQAARASGCARVLSEDMQAGAQLSDVQIVNPFTGYRALARRDSRRGAVRSRPARSMPGSPAW